MKINPHSTVAVSAIFLGLLTTFLHSHTFASSLLIAGFGGDAVGEFDRASGAFTGSFASHPSMDGPTAMVSGSDGNLYVLNEFSKNVLRFNGTTGAFIDEFISTADFIAAGVSDPGDMEIGPDGNFYISSHFSEFDSPNTAVWKFDAGTGALLSDFASFGAFSHTHGLAFGPGGKMYMNDLGAAVIRQFNSATGAYIGVFASHPLLSLGADLAVAPDGSLYVTCDGGNGVQHFSSTGIFLGSLIAPGAFQSYWGILIDGGSLYVGNKATGVVKEFTDTGTFVADRFTEVPGPFDMIPKTVPEPSAGALAMLGALAFAHRRGRRESRSYFPAGSMV